MTDFTAFAKEFRPRLERALFESIDELCGEVLTESMYTATLWQDALRRELSEYAAGGKMIRGLLVAYWARLYGVDFAADEGAKAASTASKASTKTAKLDAAKTSAKKSAAAPAANASPQKNPAKNPENNSAHDALFHVAAAVELLQTFLLIHDDIMDDDELRRDMPSMHVRLGRIARLEAGTPEDIFDLPPSVPGKDAMESKKDPFARMGESLAICAGDIVFSHALHVLNRAMPDARRAVSLFSLYVSRVGIAQMNDMYFQCAADPPTKDDVLAMYEGKTGHYTFTLPSLLGYLYACSARGVAAEEKTIAAIARAGGLFGKLFQIRDDVLDAREDSSVTGKPRGSDLMQKKQTFLVRVFFECARDRGEYETAYELWQTDIGTTEVNDFCVLADAWGVWALVDKECDALAAELDEALEDIDIAAEGKAALKNLARYVTGRKA